MTTFPIQSLHIPNVMGPTTAPNIPMSPSSINMMEPFFVGIQSALVDTRTNADNLVTSINASLGCVNAQTTTITTGINDLHCQITQLMDKVEALEMTIEAQQEVIANLTSFNDLMQEMKPVLEEHKRKRDAADAKAERLKLKREEEERIERERDAEMLERVKKAKDMFVMKSGKWSLEDEDDTPNIDAIKQSSERFGWGISN